jgi:hypothetical protein
VAYMDADMSTGLDAFLPLIAPLLSGHSDLAIGSRLAHGATVVRGPKREIISRAYNLLLRTVLSARFAAAGYMRNAGSRPGAPRSSRRCFLTSKTMPGFSTPSS